MAKKTTAQSPRRATGKRLPARASQKLDVDTRSFLPRQHPVLCGYLDKVRIWHGFARFIGLPALVETSKDVPLERLYVPPRLASGPIEPEAMNDREKPPLTFDLIDALVKHPRLIVLGDPGSGKSTLINFVSDCLARSSASPLRERLGADLIPLPFILRELGVSEEVTWESLCDAFLARPTGQMLGHSREERRQMFEALMCSGQGWVLLDGLDEIGSAKVREDLRNTYHAAAKANPLSRFLLTSRVVGYEEVPFDLDYSEVPMKGGGTMRIRARKDAFSSEPGPTGDQNHEVLRAYHADVTALARRHGAVETHRLFLAPFDDCQVREFTRNWWMHHRGNPALASAEAEEFLSALHAKDDTRTLGRVPNLLVLIALVYKVFVKLPDGRADLYWKIAEAYLENIDRSYRLSQRLPYGYRQMAGWLGHVAWNMQLRRHRDAVAADKDSENKKKPASDILITHEDALNCLTEAICDLDAKSEGQARSLATTFLDYVARRSGLFIPRGEDAKHRNLFAFMHLSFQEFFCAVYLHDRVGRMSWWHENVFAKKDKSSTALAVLREYAARAEWAEVFVFLMEMLKLGDRDKPVALLRGILNEHPNESGWRNFDAPFPELPAWAKNPKRPRQSRPRRMSSPRLVELVASLAMNSEVIMPTEARKTLLHHSWEWELRRCAEPMQCWAADNFVARVLVARRADAKDSWSALKSLRASATALSFAGCAGLTDLSPLACLENLESLDLSGCAGVVNFEPLAELGHLQTLVLGGCSGITTLDPFAKLKKLTVVDLSNIEGLTDLAPLSSLIRLESLVLRGCSRLTDLSPLVSLTRISFLLLDGCVGITDLAALTSLVDLEFLTLQDCVGLTDLHPIASLAKLRYLDVSRCTGLQGASILSTLAQRGVRVTGP